MRELIERLFLRDFATMPIDGVGVAAMDDGAAIRMGDQWLVITTDSHVIHPIFFPGGDIGRLSICGTVNDLAMMGATTVLGLTCSVILEEGFSLESLEAIQRSMIAACREACAPVVTGDTKVMGRRELDGIVINTCGIGLTRTLVRDNGLSIGDRIIVTGSIAEHGLAVMAARHSIEIEGDLVSDVAPLNSLVASFLGAFPDAVTAMKDPTRGCVSSALHEMASKHIRIDVAGAVGTITIDRSERFNSLDVETAQPDQATFGTVYLIWGLRRSLRRDPLAVIHPHDHHHVHGHNDHDHGLTEWSLFLLFSADPCVAVIPMIIASAGAGWHTVGAVVLAYELATIGTMVVLVIAAHAGARALHAPWIDRYGDAIAGALIVSVGAAMAVLGL